MSQVIEQLAHASGLADIHDKVVAGERLTGDDGIRLFHSGELMAVGAIVLEIRWSS